MVQLGTWILSVVIYSLPQGKTQLKNCLIFEEERHIMHIVTQFTYNALYI